MIKREEWRGSGFFTGRDNLDERIGKRQFRIDEALHLHPQTFSPEQGHHRAISRGKLPDVRKAGRRQDLGWQGRLVRP